MRAAHNIIINTLLALPLQIRTALACQFCVPLNALGDKQLHVVLHDADQLFVLSALDALS